MHGQTYIKIPPYKYDKLVDYLKRNMFNHLVYFSLVLLFIPIISLIHVFYHHIYVIIYPHDILIN